jgi:polyvinyl alcohol dehydrogenase (cytochrome)
VGIGHVARPRARGAVAGMAAVAIGFAAIAVVGPAVAAGPSVAFPAYMHDAGHSALVADATAISPTTPLKLGYVFKAAAVAGRPAPSFVSTPVVVDHVVYVGSNSGDFYAIDLATGTVLWDDFLGFQSAYTCGYDRGFAATAVAGTDPVSGTPMIYAPSGDGYLYALRASDGAVMWKRGVNVPSPGVNDRMNYSSPELANGRVYIGLSSFCDNPLIRGGVVALDQATGKKVGTFFTVPRGQLGGSVWSSPAVAPDGSVIITTGNAAAGALIGTAQSIVRLDGVTMKRLDSYQLLTKGADSDFGASPTLFSATLHGVSTPMVGACNKNGFYYAWKLGDLAAGPVWRHQIALTGTQANGGICLAGAIWDGSSLYITGTPTKVDGTLVPGSIRKLDPATGAAIWTTALPAAAMTTPTMDGAGAIVATSYDFDPSVVNSAFLVDAATGAFTVVSDGGKRAAPSGVFADDALLIATSAGKIYVYHPASPAAR